MARREVLATCETCSKKLYKGDKYFPYADGPDFCEEHAPSLADLIKECAEVIEDHELSDEDFDAVIITLRGLRGRISLGESPDTKAVSTL